MALLPWPRHVHTWAAGPISAAFHLAGQVGAGSGAGRAPAAHEVPGAGGDIEAALQLAGLCRDGEKGLPSWGASPWSLGTGCSTAGHRRV